MQVDSKLQLSPAFKQAIMVEHIARYANLSYHLNIIERARAAAAQPRSAPPASSPRIHRVDLRLSADQLADVVTRYTAGESSRAIAKRYEISKHKVIELVEADGRPFVRDCLRLRANRRSI